MRNRRPECGMKCDESIIQFEIYSTAKIKRQRQIIMKNCSMATDGIFSHTFFIEISTQTIYYKFEAVKTITRAAMLDCILETTILKCEIDVLNFNLLQFKN